MKTESQLRAYLEDVKKHTIEAQKARHKYLELVGKTIISTIMYVLEDDNCIDLNRLEELVN